MELCRWDISCNGWVIMEDCIAAASALRSWIGLGPEAERWPKRLTTVEVFFLNLLLPIRKFCWSIANHPEINLLFSTVTHTSCIWLNSSMQNQLTNHQKGQNIKSQMYLKYPFCDVARLMLDVIQEYMNGRKCFNQLLFNQLIKYYQQNRSIRFHFKI